MSSSIPTVTTSAVALAFVCALSAPISKALFRRFRIGNDSYQPVDGLYEDRDGKATSESQERFSTRLPTGMALVAVATGLVISVADALLPTTRAGGTLILESWLRVVAWV